MKVIDEIVLNRAELINNVILKRDKIYADNSDKLGPFFNSMLI